MEEAFTLLSEQIAANNLMLKAIIMSIWGEEKGKKVCLDINKQVEDLYKEAGKERNNE